MSDLVGYIRAILPRYRAEGQRKAMEMHNIPSDRIIQEGGGKKARGTRADMIRMSAAGRVFAIQHLFLLADPTAKRKRGGTRADLWKALDAIEAKGGVIWELYSDLRTDDRQSRDKMTRAAIDALAKGRHKTEGSDKRGRPKQEFTPAQTQQAHDAWHSRRLKTWDAVKAKMPKGFSLSRAYKAWGARNTDNG